jgi:hypothetical protein
MKISSLLPQNSSIAEKAYSIIEVLVGAAVFGLGLVSLLAGISSGYTLTELSREDLRATQIMMERMETIRLYNWSQLNGGNGFVIPTVFTNAYYPPGLGSNAGGIYYTGQLAILPPTNLGTASYSNSVRSINVTLQWKSGNILRSRNMSTLVSSNGIQNYVYN